MVFDPFMTWCVFRQTVATSSSTRRVRAPFHPIIIAVVQHGAKLKKEERHTRVVFSLPFSLFILFIFNKSHVRFDVPTGC